MHDLQWQVQDAIDQLVSSGAERGLQVAVEGGRRRLAVPISVHHR